MKNMKIKNKLLLSFAVVITFSVILISTGFVGIRHVDRMYTEMLEFPVIRMTTASDALLSLAETRRYIYATIAYIGEPESIQRSMHSAAASRDVMLEQIQVYENAVIDDPSMTESERQTRLTAINDLRRFLDMYALIALEIQASIMDFQLAEARAHLASGIDAIESMVFLLSYSRDLEVDVMRTQSEVLTDQTHLILTVMITSSVVMIAASIALAAYVANKITKPINELVDVANNVANGNLNVNIRTTDSADETGMLAESFSAVINNMSNILNDIDVMYKDHENGVMDRRIDSSRYKGSYQDVATGVNTMVNSYVLMLEDIFKVLGGFANGQFDTDLKQYKGQKEIVNKEIGLLRTTIEEIAKEINIMVSAGAAGDLSKRSDCSKYRGQWSEIMQCLNLVLDSVIDPITEAQSVMLEMSKGNLNVSVNGDYAGEFKQIKDSINNTVTVISSIINEISDVLTKIAQGDLRISITREYIGQFSTIKESINTIIDSLNSTMGEITMASDQVLQGSKQISDSSAYLAQGATEQSEAITALMVSVNEINSQTHKNAESASNANNLSDISVSNASTGNMEMKNMLESMDGIKDSSTAISKIIKVIEDIAFQTNLLALNAAVEAARAGEHGKGFAVVAEEVRNLAARSQNAAQETTSLIESSIERVGSGTETAHSTAKSFDKILQNSTEISGIISEITKASLDQADSVSQVSSGLNRISEVVQSNTSSTEQTASVAQELNSQAELLKQLVAFFKIK